MLEVGFVLGVEMVFGADVLEKVGEDGDFRRIFSTADGKALFSVVTPEAAFFFFHFFKNGFFGLS